MRLYGSNSLLKGSYMLLLLVITFEIKAGQVIISSGEGKVYALYENKIDALVLMNGVSAMSELKVIAASNDLTIDWYEFYNSSSTPALHDSPLFLSNQSTITPSGNCGYLVKMDGMLDGKAYSEKMTIFVVDYRTTLPSDLVLTVDPLTNCDEVVLQLSGNYPTMQFAVPSGMIFPVKRELKLEYKTLEWQDEWSEIEMRESVEPDENKRIKLNTPPLTDTYFTLKGDQFASDMGILPVEVSTSLYQARKVACKITTTATVRTGKHESDRPESVSAISGSAPLEIRFNANGNEPVANYYNWTIEAESGSIVSRTDAEHSYTFTQAGTFRVKVNAENAYCTASDSLVIKVSESAISAPNVFSPNADGINDEFRVSYKSIVEFQGIIYNRWGTKVFEWTDIQKGWDGTKNGKPVSEGPYFYVIKAKGSDGLVYDLKGDINLLRGRTN